MTIEERFEGTHPGFQSKIKALAQRAGLGPLDVFAMWREYSDTCSAYDQSALLSEFEQWYADKLKPAATA